MEWRCTTKNETILDDQVIDQTLLIFSSFQNSDPIMKTFTEAGFQIKALFKCCGHSWTKIFSIKWAWSLFKALFISIVMDFEGSWFSSTGNNVWTKGIKRKIYQTKWSSELFRSMHPEHCQWNIFDRRGQKSFPSCQIEWFLISISIPPSANPCNQISVYATCWWQRNRVRDYIRRSCRRPKIMFYFWRFCVWPS